MLSFRSHGGISSVRYLGTKSEAYLFHCFAMRAGHGSKARCRSPASWAKRNRPSAMKTMLSVRRVRSTMVILQLRDKSPSMHWKNYFLTKSCCRACRGAFSPNITSCKFCSSADKIGQLFGKMLRPQVVRSNQSCSKRPYERQVLQPRRLPLRCWMLCVRGC